MCVKLLTARLVAVKSQQLDIPRMLRSVAIVATLFLVGHVDSVVFAISVEPSSPLHSWLFDDGAGTTATAYTGGQDGTLVNGPSWVSDTPFVYGANNAINYIGANDPPGPLQYTAIDSIVPHGGSAWTDFSVSAWFKPATDSGHRGIIADFTPGGGTSGTTGNYLIRIRPDNTVDAGVWATDGASVRYQNTATTVNIGQWNHVTMVSSGNGTSVTIYLNGVATVAATINAGFAATSLVQNSYIGNLADFGAFAGIIDEVAIWNTALSSDNVEWLEANSLSQIPIPEPSSFIIGGLAAIGLVCMFRRR